MKKKLNCILLIDDVESDNHYHKTIIEKMKIAEQIVICNSSKQALEFLTQSGKNPPELIFLDIRMPGTDGWEFLDEFIKTEIHLHSKIVLIILAATLNPSDILRAEEISVVTDFYPKPLTYFMLTNILGRHFPDYNTTTS